MTGLVVGIEIGHFLQYNHLMLMGEEKLAYKFLKSVEPRIDIISTFPWDDNCINLFNC